MKPPIVWLVLDSRSFGGIESHCLELMHALKSEFDVRVKLVSDYGEHPTFQGVNTQVLSGGWQRSFRQEQPIAVHTHGYKASLLARLWLRPLGARLITTFHAGEKLSGLLGLYEWLNRKTAFINHANFAVSQAIQNTVSGTCYLQANFVTPKPCAADGKQIAFVGRLSEEKGHDRLPELAATIGKSIHVYGSGDLASIGNAPGLQFEGAKASMQPHWPHIRVLIMPSRYEGLPMAAIEALAHGIPVIAMDVGGLSSLVGQGRNGALISDYSPKAFADAVHCELRTDQAERAACAAARQQFIEAHFSPHVCLAALVKAYRGNTTLETQTEECLP